MLKERIFQIGAESFTQSHDCLLYKPESIEDATTFLDLLERFADEDLVDEIVRMYKAEPGIYDKEQRLRLLQISFKGKGYGPIAPHPLYDEFTQEAADLYSGKLQGKQGYHGVLHSVWFLHSYADKITKESLTMILESAGAFTEEVANWYYEFYNDAEQNFGEAGVCVNMLCSTEENAKAWFNEGHVKDKHWMADNHLAKLKDVVGLEFYNSFWAEAGCR